MIPRASGEKRDLGFTLVGLVLVFTGLGYLLDHWARTGPWLMIAGVFVGAGLGFAYLVSILFSALGGDGMAARGQRRQRTRNERSGRCARRHRTGRGSGADADICGYWACACGRTSRLDRPSAAPWRPARLCHGLAVVLGAMRPCSRSSSSSSSPLRSGRLSTCWRCCSPSWWRSRCCWHGPFSVSCQNNGAPRLPRGLRSLTEDKHAAGAGTQGSKIVEAMAELNNKAVITSRSRAFDFSITNTVLYMWLVGLIVFVLFFVAPRR